MSFDVAWKQALLWHGAADGVELCARTLTDLSCLCWAGSVEGQTADVSIANCGGREDATFDA